MNGTGPRSAAVRAALTALLVSLLLVPPGAGSLKLCVCAGDQHRGFCGQPEAPQPAPKSCCSSRATPKQAPASRPCPGCPTLELADGPTLILPPQRGADEGTAAPCGDIILIAPPAPASHASAGPGWWCRPPPTPLRLHLLHSVFLC
jgi:hypothetical protein